MKHAEVQEIIRITKSDNNELQFYFENDDTDSDDRETAIEFFNLKENKEFLLELFACNKCVRFNIYFYPNKSIAEHYCSLCFMTWYESSRGCIVIGDRIREEDEAPKTLFD